MSQSTKLRDARSAEERDLVDAARRGDQLAFRQIVENHADGLARTVASMLGPGGIVDDVLQDVFVQFYNSLQSFRGDSSVKTYLNRIAVNKSLDILRRRKRSLKRFVGLDDTHEAELVDGSSSLPDLDRTVWKAIAGLSENQRAVVTLRLVEGYSTEETAEMLGIKYGTVLSRLNRACNNLKEVLRPLQGE